MTAREEILARIRTALPGASNDPSGSHAGIARDYDRAGRLDIEGRLDLFIDRLLDYDTEIVQIEDASEMPAAIAKALEHFDSHRVIAPVELLNAWLPPGLNVQRDGALTTAEIEDAESVITTCEVAVASTGTLMLVHTGAQGRRVLTLLPDHHVCIVHRSQVVELVSEALAHLSSKSMLPITTISGPSATADIEMTRIRGVHGPRRLTVVLYGR